MKAFFPRSVRLLALVAAGLLVAVSVPVEASPVAGIIHGTGKNGISSRDPYWSIVGAPNLYTPPESYPYQAFTTYNGDIGWYNASPFTGAQTGLTNADGTFYWDSLNAGHGSPLGFGSGQTAWIAAQDFTVATAGWYSFTFPALADELLDIYINGSVQAAAKMPTIVGGTKVSDAWTSGVNFGSPTTLTTTAAYLNVGTNTFYARVLDSGFSTGLLLGDIRFQSAAPPPGVPEIDPAGLASVMTLVAGSLALLERRRSKTA